MSSDLCNLLQNIHVTITKSGKSTVFLIFVTILVLLSNYVHYLIVILFTDIHLGSLLGSIYRI